MGTLEHGDMMTQGHDTWGHGAMMARGHDMCCGDMTHGIQKGRSRGFTQFVY